MRTLVRWIRAARAPEVATPEMPAELSVAADGEVLRAIDGVRVAVERLERKLDTMDARQRKRRREGAG